MAGIDFKLWQPQTHSNQYLRLLSLAGSHRYQYWQVAWKAFTGSPFHGIGPGTFQFYWFQHTTHAEYIQNAHSLWFETLAETGIIGWLLIVGFFALAIVGGIVRCLRAASTHRAVIATATAGVIAFCAAASFDWIWQIGVVPMVAMLLVAVTVMPESATVWQPGASGPRASYTAGRRLRPRLALGLGSVLAVILIAIPLASTVAVRASQAAVAKGQLAKALADANTAQAIEPGAASPYLQRALVLETGQRHQWRVRSDRGGARARANRLQALARRRADRGRKRTIRGRRSPTTGTRRPSTPPRSRSADEHRLPAVISSGHAP